METITLARMAMATRFEAVITGEDSVRLRAAGEEALREVKRLENQMSFYSDASDVSRLNRVAHQRPVAVDGRLFELMVRAKELWQLTAGAFDVTVGPLMRCWGLTGAEGRVPPEAELEEVRSRTGMQLVELDENRRTVRYLEAGVEVDLGGIAKGFAVDEAIAILREAGVAGALLHGGTSTVGTIGTAPDGRGWRVAVGTPQSGRLRAAPDTASATYVGVAELVDSSLSVSDIGGKYFTLDGLTYGHVIDPRSGRPCQGPSLAAVQLASATDADALSTALLVATREESEALADTFPDMRSLVVDAIGGVRAANFLTQEIEDLRA